MKTIIESSNAPEPIGPYSQAVRAGNLIFISGQIAIDRQNGNMVQNNIKAEATQVMKNIEFILNEAGLTFANVVKTTIFLKTMDDFASVNEVYSIFFKNDFPARETVAVSGLPKNANVEISITAVAS